ncbi:hypothetical protein BCR33DRAFT_718810 [Rhizoclosmatium globosum]|uniref:BZIP domain-containing protein n=1 Tax=Rhizoclosmatium globosum TaxID=329046 RepID=A0A1Y2C448_9FUNG|nr:hypothetical protein BCR33DRAFT_718810 [Rhizoclosmatium globosum]|eukprot:ORY41667.1 hypothetical protein BCR33DRAFT_718810 [Rhizoclosmatium globosum]
MPRSEPRTTSAKTNYEAAESPSSSSSNVYRSDSDTTSDSAEAPKPVRRVRKGTSSVGLDKDRRRQVQKKEAAKAFRERQRIHLQQLEQRVRDLEQRDAIENRALKERLEQLELQNRRLREASFSFASNASAKLPASPPSVACSPTFFMPHSNINDLLIFDRSLPALSPVSAGVNINFSSLLHHHPQASSN